jgi:hypothetical protein
MFENATNMIQKHLPAGDYPGWVAPLVTLGIAWIIFWMIREFWCWFLKTNAIANELETINSNLRDFEEIAFKCHEELAKAKSTLERIAESASAAAGKK